VDEGGRIEQGGHHALEAEEAEEAEEGDVGGLVARVQGEVVGVAGKEGAGEVVAAGVALGLDIFGGWLGGGRRVAPGAGGGLFEAPAVVSLGPETRAGSAPLVRHPGLVGMAVWRKPGGVTVWVDPPDAIAAALDGGAGDVGRGADGGELEPGRGWIAGVADVGADLELEVKVGPVFDRQAIRSGRDEAVAPLAVAELHAVELEGAEALVARRDGDEGRALAVEDEAEGIGWMHVELHGRRLALLRVVCEIEVDSVLCSRRLL
jgi:hypothetical protein